MSLRFAPGCELHLIQGGAAQTVRVQAGDVPQDIAAQAVYQGFSAAVVAQQNGTFTPVGVGQTVGLVTFTDAANNVFSGFLTIHVHHTLTDLWFGNQHITMRAGASNYVPTVFAAFDDLAIADVTGHAWVTVSVTGNGVVSVQQGDAWGRLRADVLAAGRQDVVVVNGGGKRATVPVFVTPSVDTVRPILNPLQYHGPHTTRRNLLFLAEGFADRDVFEQHVMQLVDLLFSSSAHSPYPQLREHVNVWTAFEAPPAGVVAEAGVTVGPAVNDGGEPLPLLSGYADVYNVQDITALVGFPPGPGAPADAAAARLAWLPPAVPSFVPAKLADEVFAMWKRQVVRGLTAPKDTTFGLLLGGRPSGPESPEPHAATPLVPANATPHWDLFPLLPIVTLSPDPRRLPEDPGLPGFLNPNTVAAFGDFLESYLEALKYGVDTTQVDYDVGRVWKRDGSDTGLIAILVNEDLFAGTQFGWTDASGVEHRVGLAWGLGSLQALKLVTSGPRLDHTVTTTKPHYDTIVGTLSHELTHALGLGDEYEDIYNANHGVAGPAIANEFDVSTNLMHGSYRPDPHVAALIDAQGHVTRVDIKWNWPRIALASPLAMDVPVPPPGDPATTTTLQLEPTQGMKWRRVRDQGLDVFLRVRELNPGRAGSTYQPAIGPFKIRSVTGDTVVIDGPFVSPLSYKAGSVLYLPVRKGNDVRTLVDPAVAADLAAHGPFGINSNPQVVNFQGESARKDISGFSKPKHRESVIGVYEGGGEYTSGVYRPSGNCKMRELSYTATEWRWFLHFIPHPVDVTRQRAFCFVCKYILINEVWPGAYDLLDREYPEDC